MRNLSWINYENSCSSKEVYIRSKLKEHKNAKNKPYNNIRCGNGQSLEDDHPLIHKVLLVVHNQGQLRQVCLPYGTSSNFLAASKTEEHEIAIAALPRVWIDLYPIKLHF